MHEVLGPVEPVLPDSPIERLFEDIDEYVGEVTRDPEVGEGSGIQDKGKEVVVDSSTESDKEEGDDKDKDDDNDDDCKTRIFGTD